jgi:2-isopropylmalate synthase
MEKDRVLVFDTTLRDGEQAPGFSMNVAEKVRLARQLEKLGVDVIEAGFPIASEGDFEGVRAVAREMKKARVAGFCRAREQDIVRAAEALEPARQPRIHIFLATSDIHLEKKLMMSRTQAVDAAARAVRTARKYVDDVEFCAEDATRSDRDFLCRVFSAVLAEGAATINIPDTVGYAVPDEFRRLIRHIRQNVGGLEKAVLSVHCHNDLGLAVANSLAALKAGARQVECTVNGIGERAGNASLEEIVMTLWTRREHYPVWSAIETREIHPTSRLLTEITGVAVQPNKAIVGANAFAHEAGIHQDGVLKDRRTYEIITPATVGLASSTLVLGKHSGRHALKERLKTLGFDLTDANLSKVFDEFKALADRQKVVLDRDLQELIARLAGDPPYAFGSN